MVELLCAVPLMGIATALTLLLLVQAAADRRRHAQGQAGAREMRHAIAVLASDLAPLRSTDLRIVSDSLLELRSQLGVAIICATDSASVDVASPPAERDSPWLDALRAGDPVRAWQTPQYLLDDPVEVSGFVSAPTRRLGAGVCGAQRVRQRWRVSTTLGQSPNVLLVGAPLVAQRDVQYLHYKSNGQWWLGRRARDGAIWEVTQPVVGPLESPTKRGLQLRGLAASALETGVRDSMASLLVTLRVPPPRQLASIRNRLVLPPESTHVELALRAAAWHRGRP